MKLLIVGYNQPGQMGHYLMSAAAKIDIDHDIVDAAEAEASSRIGQAFYWRLRGKKPAHLHRFSTVVVERCTVSKPDVVLTTGIRAPLKAAHISALRESGIKVINYSTDDPWNKVLSAPWFLSALPAYDAVFSPRRANFSEFRKAKVRALYYLPFGYDPDVHRPWPNGAPGAPRSDLLFVGGCDSERQPLISALADAGLELALFGRYWDRHAKTRRFWRGVADQETIRAATATTGISLCLVRRANRDGHVMRSYEAAAIGGCLLAEDTSDHRELLGPEGCAAQYFANPSELVAKARKLAADADARGRLAQRLRERMVARRDTYADRLSEMLKLSTDTLR